MRKPKTLTDNEKAEINLEPKKFDIEVPVGLDLGYKKPILVRCGNNFVNPEDVVSIRQVKGGELWIVKFKSEPNPEYPTWLKPDEVKELLQFFDIKSLD